MIPRIIHQTSRTKALAPEEQRLRARAQRLLPGWKLCLWDDNDNLSMMQEYFPDLVGRYSSLQPGVAKADIARCVYLHAFGGFYFDTDYKLLRSLDTAILSHRCVLPISREGSVGSTNFRLGNAVLGSVAGHPFWSGFIYHVLTRLGDGAIGEALVENTTGPEALTAYYVERFVSHPDIFLPPRLLFHPPVGRFGAFRTSVGSFGVHLCWGSWRSKNPQHLIRNAFSRIVASH